MGQQQLILLVIGVVLVAIATLAAYEALDRNYRQDEADGLLERALAIATHAAGWHSVNLMFGGGNGSYERLAAGGLGALSLDSTTVRGRYRITAATATTLEITGVSTRRPDIGVRVYVTDFDVDSSRVSFTSEFSL